MAPGRGANLFAFKSGSKLEIVRKAFPRASIAYVVEEVKWVSGSHLQPQQESILKQLGGLGQQCRRETWR
jgi:hypothetical protein